MKIITLFLFVIAGFGFACAKNNNPHKQWLDSLLAHDKLIHVLGCQVLFMLAYVVFGNEKVAFLVVVTIGLAIEIAQAHPSVGRGFSWGDLVADAAGAILAIAIRWI